MFAQQRNSSTLDDRYLMLINAHNNMDIFTYAQETESEKKIPRIFQKQAGLIVLCHMSMF